MGKGRAEEGGKEREKVCSQADDIRCVRSEQGTVLTLSSPVVPNGYARVPERQKK